MVFFTSSAFFCAEYESQCITVPKILATVLVVSGLLIFVYSKQAEAKSSTDTLIATETLIEVQVEAPLKIN